jgi:hypothetical protein
MLLRQCRQTVRITALLAQAVLGGMPSPVAMKALPEILLFVSFIISLIFSFVISLIPPWTSAAFTGFAAITTTFLCKEQSFWSEPFRSLDSSFLFDKLGDDLIGGGGDRGVFVHHELREDFPFVVPWDSAKEVEDVLFLTHLGDCLCRRIGVGSRWPCAEIVILDFQIDLRCVIVDISAVL